MGSKGGFFDFFTSNFLSLVLLFILVIIIFPLFFENGFFFGN